MRVLQCMLQHCLIRHAIMQCLMVQAVAVVQRAMRGAHPAEVMADMGFGDLSLQATFPVSMSGEPTPHACMPQAPHHKPAHCTAPCDSPLRILLLWQQQLAAQLKQANERSEQPAKVDSRLWPLQHDLQ